jgi:hypothetical protein
MNCRQGCQNEYGIFSLTPCKTDKNEATILARSVAAPKLENPDRLKAGMI